MLPQLGNHVNFYNFYVNNNGTCYVPAVLLYAVLSSDYPMISSWSSSSKLPLINSSFAASGFLVKRMILKLTSAREKHT